MSLNSDLISQFVKSTNDTKRTKQDSLVYGTICADTNKVRLDGSTIDTPVETTSTVKEGDRVMVTIKNHTAIVTGNLTDQSASNNDFKSTNQSVDTAIKNLRAEFIQADKIVTDELLAVNARIDTITAGTVTTEHLNAVNAKIDNLGSTYATITRLESSEANIISLQSSVASISTLINDKATIAQLNAVEADIRDLESATANIGDLSAKVGTINTLIYGSASGSSMQSSFANSVAALIGDAKIKSAMIESIDASKIAAGDIITDNITVKSNNGRLLISDETIQISDSSRVRVQIGKDASNDYSINIWDESGNLMFSEGGITDKAIKSAIIRDEMVSSSANISASKLNINSLFTAINNDTSNTLKATKVKLDEQGQSLEVAFNTLNTSVENQNETISGHETRLTLVEGKLESKIWEQDISTAIDRVNGQISTLSTNYSTLTQTVSGLSSTVASHTTQISNKADNSAVTTVNNKVTSLEQNLDGFRTTVSSTYASKTEIYRNNLLEGTSNKWTDIGIAQYNGVVKARTHCSKYGLKAGDTITFSLELNPLVKAGLRARLDFYSNENDDTGKTTYISDVLINKDSPGLSPVTATIPEGKEYLVLLIANNDSTDIPYTSTEQYRKAKLERGTHVTDWTRSMTDFGTTEEILADMYVGGTNYLANSYISPSYAALKDGGEYYSNSTSGRAVLLFNNLTLIPGTYTFSCYVKQLGADGNPRDTETHLRFYKNGSTIDYYDTKATSGEWTRVSYTFTVESSDDVYLMYFRSFDSSIGSSSNVEQIWIKKIKIEQGTVATDWRPAQADIDARFVSAENRITSAESSITQLNNKITANVTETTNLGTRTSTLEQTATGITTRLDNQVIGGTNVLRGTNTVTTLGSSAAWSKGTWRTAGTGDGARSVIDISDAPNAWIKKGFSITADDGDTTTCQDYIPVAEGLEYTISCYARGSGTLRLQVGRSPYTAKTFTFSGATTWTKCSMTFVAGDGNGMTDGCTNAYFGNRGTAGTTLELCGFKMEVGNTASDWTPSPYDTDVAVSNFMRFDSAGLMVADMSASTIGNNVLIDSDSVDIRKGNTVLASFSANKVILGQNAENSIIDLCNGAGTISSLISEASTSVPHRDSILISSQEVHTKSIHFKANVSNAYGASSTPTISREAELYMLRSTSTSTESCARLQAQHTTNSSGAYTKSGFSAMTYDSAGSTRALIFASDSANSAHNQINVYPTKTRFTKPLYRYDAGTEYEVFDSSMDSGWKNATIGSDFVVYSSDDNSKVRYRKFGKIVEIRGAVKPTAAWAAGDDNRTIFTLPSGYRPSSQITVKSQGSGAYSWLLSITNGGAVRCARYNNGSEYIAYSTGTWLPFNATFMVD